MNRFIRIGLTTPPCGTPRCRGVCTPSSVSNGATSHRSIYSRIQSSLMWVRSAFIKRPWSISSKAALMSNSTSQSYRQHRSRVMAIACLADLPGLYPYESGWKIGSSIGSIRLLTTVWQTRSATVGIPNFLTPPVFLGISTCLTGGGKYDPDDIRFHSL